MIEIREITGELQHTQWDAYMLAHSQSVMDLSAWRKVLFETYSIRSYFLAAYRDDQMCGALALYEIKHILWGHYLVTAPFGTDGGIHADDEETLQALIRAGRALADRLDVQYALIRSRQFDLSAFGFAVDHHYVAPVVALPDADTFWEELPSKTRRAVRKGRKQGFSLASGEDQIRYFHQVFQQHMQDLGSPAHPLRLYERILFHLREHAQFLVLRSEDSLVGAALLFTFNGTATNLHSVTLKEFNTRAPNSFLYWKMFEGSIERGCTSFDMGRSAVDSSTLHYKRNWNPTIVPLSYNYYLRKLKEVPFIHPNNPRYQFAIRVWRKLPRRVVQTVGPFLIRGVA